MLQAFTFPGSVISTSCGSGEENSRLSSWQGLNPSKTGNGLSHGSLVGCWQVSEITLLITELRENSVSGYLSTPTGKLFCQVACQPGNLVTLRYSDRIVSHSLTKHLYNLIPVAISRCQMLVSVLRMGQEDRPIQMVSGFGGWISSNIFSKFKLSNVASSQR